jgi:transposase
VAAQAWSSTLGGRGIICHHEPFLNIRSTQAPTPEQRIKALEVELADAQHKAQLFEAMLDVLKKDYGVRVIKKPLGKSSRKSASKA